MAKDRARIIEQYKARKGSARLTAREEAIFEMRFGMTDGAPKTLEEVARNFGVTRERIRQIEAHVLDKIGFEEN